MVYSIVKKYRRKGSPGGQFKNFFTFSKFTQLTPQTVFYPVALNNIGTINNGYLNNRLIPVSFLRWKTIAKNGCGTFLDIRKLQVKKETFRFQLQRNNVAMVAISA